MAIADNNWHELAEKNQQQNTAQVSDVVATTIYCIKYAYVQHRELVISNTLGT